MEPQDLVGKTIQSIDRLAVWGRVAPPTQEDRNAGTYQNDGYRITFTDGSMVDICASYSDSNAEICEAEEQSWLLTSEGENA